MAGNANAPHVAPRLTSGGVEGSSPHRSRLSSSQTSAYLHSGFRVFGSLSFTVRSTASSQPSGVRVPRRSAQSGHVSGRAPHSGSGEAPQPLPPF
ncbi:hypothetical protein NDU88_000985 [Pleurodeles waltl]|uniref:Uncharacterized protein n=1 Tax=Pleurodeles waltl TaxID=8319 RepID=A0AAV7P5S4_PLEWA|nr:hypothetical protein NDU88_000985 [Pleurodeles waltl]